MCVDLVDKLPSQLTCDHWRISEIHKHEASWIELTTGISVFAADLVLDGGAICCGAGNAGCTGYIRRRYRGLVLVRYLEFAEPTRDLPIPLDRASRFRRPHFADSRN